MIESLTYKPELDYQQRYEERRKHQELLKKALLNNDRESFFTEYTFIRNQFGYIQSMYDIIGILSMKRNLYCPLDKFVYNMCIMKHHNKGTYFLRHAESIQNVSSDTHHDPVLTPAGLSVLKEYNSWAIRMGIEFDEVYVSPLTRSLQTVYHILENTKTLPSKVIVDSRITEALRNVSSVGTCRDIIANHPQFKKFDFSRITSEKWWYEPEENTCYTVKKKEPKEVIKRRLDSFERDLDSDKKVLIVSHSGIILRIYNKYVTNGDILWYRHS